MHNNGVTHMTVPGDMEGVAAIVEWLAYIPKARLSLLALSHEHLTLCVCPTPQVKGGPLPETPTLDPVTRPVEYTPTKAPYDPKLMLEGRPGSGEPLSSSS